MPRTIQRALGLLGGLGLVAVLAIPVAEQAKPRKVAINNHDEGRVAIDA